MMHDGKPETLLTQREVMALTGFKSRTSLYRRSKSGDLPPPVQIGLGQIRWRAEDIDRWIQSLPKRRY